MNNNDLLSAALNQFDIDHNIVEPENIELENTPEEINIGETILETSSQENESSSGEFQPIYTGTETPIELNNTIINETSSRYSSAIWFSLFENLNITIVGLGGINSWSVIHLARLNFNKMTLIDPDTIEEVNMAGQFYSNYDIGVYKVEALRYSIYSHSNTNFVTSLTERADSNTYIEPICICGLDNMESRKVVFYNWRDRYQGNVYKTNNDLNQRFGLFIDARLSAEQLQIFAININDQQAIERYEKEWLFSQEEGESIVCSYKQTSYCAGIIGGLITNMLINHMTNWSKDLMLRNAPFMISYDANTMLLKTEL